MNNNKITHRLNQYLLEFTVNYIGRNPVKNLKNVLWTIKKSGDMSKHGVVAWLGVGSIGTDPSEFKNWLPNAGLGYRFEVQPRMNVRVDIVFGREVAGFYFNFNEAF